MTIQKLMNKKENPNLIFEESKPQDEMEEDFQGDICENDDKRINFCYRIFKFMQFLCEGHYLDIQNFLNR